MRDVTKMLLLAGVCNALATLHGLGYAALLAGDPAAHLPGGNVILAWGVLSLLMNYSISTPTMLIRFHWFDEALGRLRRGEALEPALLERAQRQALRGPGRLSRLSFFLWALAITGFPLFLHWFAPQAQAQVSYAHIAVVSLLTGGVSSVFIFYMAEWFVRSNQLELLFPDRKLSQVKRVTPVSLTARLMVMLLVCVLLPVSALTLAATSAVLTQASVVYLGVTFFIIGCIQVFFIVQSLNLPMGELAFEMSKVTRGDLSARARVVSTDHLGQLAEGFNAMVDGLRRAAFVKETFGRYVAPAVVEEILRGKIELGGEQRKVTVLFSDIRDFTALSEQRTPAEVVRFLNSYLDQMVNVVVQHGGTVDKFIGDAVMATFGVPLTREDDALRAVRTAVGMLERLDVWNADRVAQGEPPLQIGIGLHTGDAIAGNIGSTQKMEYTVIGDAVNTASRIEGLNKKLGTRLLISAETHALVQAAVKARALEPIEVKGKKHALQIYEVTGLV